MNKSYVFYTEVLAEGNLMECIYFTKGECRAQPFAKKVKVGAMESIEGEAIEYYKPNDEDQRLFCKNARPNGFRTCPRAGLYRDYLQATGLEKSKPTAAD